MRDSIVSLNDKGQVVRESCPMGLIDRLDFLSEAFNEFSLTLLEESQRFHLFSFLHDEYESLRSDLSVLVRFAEEAGGEAEERRERSECPQRAVRVPQAS